jgi:outer membrane protein OmpA-like peptidoglycan-associated protein
MTVAVLARVGSALLLVFSLAASEPAQKVETETPGVSAEVVELRQQAGLLRLAVRLVNDTDKPAALSSQLHLSQFTLIDAKAKTKHFVIKSADGHYVGGPTSDWNDGGRWAFVSIPARSHVVVWADFEPLPVGTIVSVQIPTMFPFDGIPVSAGVSKVLSSSGAVTEIPAVTATLVSARRADQELTARLRLVAGDTGIQQAPTILYQDVYFFDPQSKRKYPVIKDTEGNFQATPQTDKNSGGRFWLSFMKPQAVALMSLTIQSPPDTVTAGDLMIHGFLPIEGLAITGLGGAATGGVAAGGRTLGLEGALKELNASVTPAGIAINLSADVLFDFDKADLKLTAESNLQNLLAVVKEKATAAVTVVGHTDIRGDAAYNNALSERRAGAVKAWLVSHGVTAGRVTTSGAGESRPLKPGDTEEVHRANRRVEITIKG